MFRGVASMASRLPRSSRPSVGRARGRQKQALSALWAVVRGAVEVRFSFPSARRIVRMDLSSVLGRAARKTLGAERIQQGSTRTLLSATHRLYYKLL